MAYTSWSVVSGEQPSAAKWNQLGTNDAGFKDGTNIDDNAITMAHLNNPYIFRAYHNTTQTINGRTQVVLNSEIFDRNNNFVTNAYTAPVAGEYCFGGAVDIQADDARFYLDIDINGTAFRSGSESTKRAAGISEFVLLAASDVVKLYATTATSQTTNGGEDDTKFWGFLVNRT